MFVCVCASVCACVRVCMCACVCARVRVITAFPRDEADDEGRGDSRDAGSYVCAYVWVSA